MSIKDNHNPVPNPQRFDDNDSLNNSNFDMENDDVSHHGYDDLHQPVALTEAHLKAPKEVESSLHEQILRHSSTRLSAQGSFSNNELTRTRSIYKPECIVPHGQRRGLFSFLSLVPEYKEPRDYPPVIKNFIVVAIAAASMIGPMGTSILLPAMTQIAGDLHTTTTLVNVSFGVFLLSLGIFPMWWSSISERQGRRTVYIISFALFTALTVGCALSNSIGMFLAFRILSGGCVASVQAVGAGTIADLYITTERGQAMGLYYLGPLLGPLLSPIFGGALAGRWGWRSTQWFLLVMGGVILLFLVFALPETLRVESLPSDPIRSDKTAKLDDYDEDDVDDDILEKKIVNNENKLTSSSALEQTSKKSEDIPNVNNSRTELPKNQYNGEENKQLHNKSLDLSRTTTKSKILRSRSRRSINSTRDEVIVDVLYPSMTYDSQMRNKSRFKDTEGGDEMSVYDAIELMRQPTQQQKVERELNDLKEEEIEEELGKTSKILQTMYIYLFVPMKSLKFLMYPPVLLSIIYTSICFFCLYYINLTVEYAYSRPPYNFSTTIVGLLYIPNSVAYMIASIAGGKWSDHIVKRQQRKNNGVLIPEERIAENSFAASIIYPLSILIFSWPLHYGKHWVIPLVGTFLFGFGSMLVFGTTVTYLIDALPGRGASGVAVNNLFRLTLGAVATFANHSEIESMGVGWTGTMCCLLGLISSLCLLSIKIFGPKWRKSVNLERLYS